MSAIDKVKHFEKIFDDYIKQRYPSICKNIIHQTNVKKKNRSMNIFLESYIKSNEVYNSLISYICHQIIKYEVVIDIINNIVNNENYTEKDIYNISKLMTIIVKDVSLEELLILKQINIPTTHDIILNVIPFIYNMVDKYFNHYFIKSIYHKELYHNIYISQIIHSQSIIYYCKEFDLIMDKIKVYKTKKNKASFHLNKILLEDEFSGIIFTNDEQKIIEKIHILSRQSHKYRYSHREKGVIQLPKNNNNDKAIYINNKKCEYSIYPIENYDTDFDDIFNLSKKIITIYCGNFDKISITEIITLYHTIL